MFQKLFLLTFDDILVKFDSALRLQSDGRTELLQEYPDRAFPAMSSSSNKRCAFDSIAAYILKQILTVLIFADLIVLYLLRILKFFGDVTHKEVCIVRLVVQGKVEGQRSRGSLISSIVGSPVGDCSRSTGDRGAVVSQPSTVTRPRPVCHERTIETEDLPRP